MLSANISDFRANLKKYLDQVADDFETLIINRGKDSGIVVMSLDEYNSLNATAHEMSSKANIKRLTESIEELERGETIIKELKDL
jgi:prevent-host-death family protein